MKKRIKFDYILGKLRLFEDWSEDILNAKIYPQVTNYDALPVASTENGHLFWVQNSQGTSWLPGSLGGTFYPSGIYYSNGTTWDYIKTPYQASQSEVNTGTDIDKFITPSTLHNSDLVKKFDLVFNFLDIEQAIYKRGSNDFKIMSVTNPDSIPNITIEVNGAAYTLTNTIDQYDEVTIDVDALGLVVLACENL